MGRHCFLSSSKCMRDFAQYKALQGNIMSLSGGCIFAFSQGIPIIYSVCRKIICQFRLSSLGRKVKFSCCRPGLFSLSLLHPILHFNAQAFLPLGLGFLGTEKHPCTITPGICICIFSLLGCYSIFACVGHLPHSSYVSTLYIFLAAIGRGGGCILSLSQSELRCTLVLHPCTSASRQERVIRMSKMQSATVCHLI